jgi:transcriptional regulator with XRE-family HTH domain
MIKRHAGTYIENTNTKMKTKRLSNYLRTYRRRAGLSQNEVAFLLGCKDKVIVSRFERGTSVPTLKTALAYQAIFGASVSELFAGMYEDIESQIIEQAKLLIENYHKSSNKKVEAHKKEFLRVLIVAPDIIAENS